MSSSASLRDLRALCVPASRIYSALVWVSLAGSTGEAVGQIGAPLDRYHIGMEVTGTADGSRIELDQPLRLPAGTRVLVDVSPLEGPRKGSPASILRLAGTLTDDEAATILKGAQECRRIDAALWRDNGNEA